MRSLLLELAEQYPSLPKAVILKTALLSLGVRFHSLMVEAGKTVLPDFRFHRLPDGSLVQLPYLMVLEGGSLIRLRCREDSPFQIEPDGDNFFLMDRAEPVVRFTFADRPVWQTRKASDGVPLNGCGLNQHGDMMVLNLTPACEYWLTPFEGTALTPDPPERSCRCAFCGYGLPDARSKTLGQEQGQPAVASAVLKRAGEAVQMGVASGARHLYLTGGSMTNPNLEAERYLNIVNGIRKAADGLYLTVGSQALPPERLPAFKTAGADGICFNLEVWDREVWQRVCPGKSRFFGRNMWEASLIEAVRIFGDGNVFSAFVIGAEMVSDNTLSDPNVALNSNIEGVRWLLQRGIHPILSLFWPFAGTDMEDCPGPDLHFLLQLYSEVNQVRYELGKPFPGNIACKRCLYMQVEGDFPESW
ncbi:MAG TPA: radical SAM protein [Syntrophales bacterium]|nr:radical SAM protein [Syntrophales bacterium]